MAWDTVKLTLEFGFICPFVVIDLTDKGATTVVDLGRMIDNFLPIPKAEPLPIYRVVLRLACVKDQLLMSDGHPTITAQLHLMQLEDQQ